MGSLTHTIVHVKLALILIYTREINEETVKVAIKATFEFYIFY
jgi:hypothetical protein